MSSRTDSDTVSAYSEFGAQEYEDPANRQFLYGAMTVEFLKSVALRPDDRTVVDLGAGTGFVFDELGDQFRDARRKGIGIEPAEGMPRYCRGKVCRQRGFLVSAWFVRAHPAAASISRHHHFDAGIALGQVPAGSSHGDGTAFFAIRASCAS